jgi:hypothetical protein
VRGEIPNQVDSHHHRQHRYGTWGWGRGSEGGRGRSGGNIRVFGSALGGEGGNECTTTVSTGRVETTGCRREVVGDEIGRSFFCPPYFLFYSFHLFGGPSREIGMHRIQVFLGMVAVVLVSSFYYYCSLPLPTSTPPRRNDFQQLKKGGWDSTCPHVKPYSLLMLGEQELVKNVMEARDLGCQNVFGGMQQQSTVCKNRRNGRVCVHQNGVVKQGERIGDKLGAHRCSVSPVHCLGFTAVTDAEIWKNEVRQCGA